MTAEYAKRARQFMEDNGYLHYIYGVRVITGVVINKYDFSRTNGTAKASQSILDNIRCAIGVTGRKEQ